MLFTLSNQEEEYGACCICGGEEKCMQVFGEETWGMSPLLIYRHRMGDNIKMGIK
jgi:hypothetical protein